MHARFAFKVAAFSAVAALANAGCNAKSDPAIFDLQPRAGATQGNQPVKITGAGFRQDIGYTVYFGPKKAEKVVIADPNTLLVATPQADKAGPVDVMIRADDGNAWRVSEGFKYEEMGGNVIGNMGHTQGPAGGTKQNY